MLYFIISVLVLAGLLFIPVSKLIWVFSVRRLQRKTHTELTQTEIDAQLNRARFISLFVCLIFSFLFNLQITGLPGNG
ncbi:MAG: hypothetical protein SV201_06520 [Pseudomonadota bacterium]|nr:hypothetical protein [Pseudomonadota bacterium]